MSYQNKNSRKKTERASFPYHLLPLIFIAIVLPLVVKFKVANSYMEKFNWFSSEEQIVDFFLYYKQWLFVIVCAILLGIILKRRFISQKKRSMPKLFIPLFIYGVLTLLSTVFSDYPAFGFRGIFGQYENIFCLLGYVLVVYYAYYIIENERELKIMIHAVAIGALLVGILGTLQVFGWDYFGNSFFKAFIFAGNEKYADSYGVPSKVVYATLFNPNYLGVYTSVMITLFAVILFYTKDKREILLYSSTIVTSIISLIGSQSKVGILGVIASLFVALILLRKRVIHFWYITVPFIVALPLVFDLYCTSMNYSFYEIVKNSLFQEIHQEADLTSINTLEDGIELTYKGNTMSILLSDNHEIVLEDLDGKSLPYTIYQQNSDGSIVIQPEIGSFVEIPIINVTDSSSVVDFCIVVDGKTWVFSKKVDPTRFLYLNRFNKFSPIESKDSNIFRGREEMISGRGFIWSRTLPMLKDNLILGSGAETFILEYPQYDYVSFENYGYNTNIISKPHCLYLQVGIQSGVLALIGLLTFFGMYLVQSIRLYFKSSFTTVSEVIGIGVFIAGVNYLFTSLINDSSITVTPVIWVMIGIGIAANRMVKKEKAK